MDLEFSIIDELLPFLHIGITPIIILVLSLIWVALSYQFLITRIHLWKKLLLITIRLGILGIVFFFLSNPHTFRRSDKKILTQNKVAVVFDTSGSMNKKQKNQSSRKELALAHFESIRKAVAGKTDFRLFSLNHSTSSVPSIESIAQSNNSDHQTHLNKGLFTLIPKLNDQNYDALIVFTDGIDNDPQPPATPPPNKFNPLKTILIKTDTPLVQSVHASFTRLETPTASLINRWVPISLFLESYNLPPQDTLEIEILENGQPFKRSIIHGNQDWKTNRRINLDLPISKARWYHFQVTLKHRSTLLDKVDFWIEGRTPSPEKILFYQKTIDLNTQALKQAFNQKENYDTTFRFFPDPVFKKTTDPNSYLNTYHTIVLLNLDYQKLPLHQSNQLIEYVREGGSLLVVLNDLANAQTLQKSPLFAIMPIIFPPDPSIKEPKNLNFDPQNGRIYLSHSRLKANYEFENFEKQYAHWYPGSKQALSLKTFAITPEGKQTGIFDYFDSTQSKRLLKPQFHQTIPTLGIKRMAKTLAKSTQDQQQILLASQRIKKGLVMQITAGSLWEWSKCLPSQSQLYESFWRNLITSLHSHQTRLDQWELHAIQKKDPNFLKLSFQPAFASETDHSTTKFYHDLEGQKTAFFPRLNQDRKHEIELKLQTGEQYRIVAETENRKPVEAYLKLLQPIKNREHHRLQVDEQNLQKLQATLNASLISVSDDHQWGDWLATHQTYIHKDEKVYTWHNIWFFLAVLTLYTFELLFRRSINLI